MRTGVSNTGSHVNLPAPTATDGTRPLFAGQCLSLDLAQQAYTSLLSSMPLAHASSSNAHA